MGDGEGVEGGGQSRGGRIKEKNTYISSIPQFLNSLLSEILVFCVFVGFYHIDIMVLAFVVKIPVYRCNNICVSLHIEKCDEIAGSRNKSYIMQSAIFCRFLVNGILEVGGIYTVLRSKAPISTEELGDQYCMLGPLREERWRLEVEPIAPESRNIRHAIKKLAEGGFKVCDRYFI